MSRFELLTKYIEPLGMDEHGKWIFDNVNDGSKEHPKQWPFVRYSQAVDAFEMEFFEFCECHPEFEHSRYGSTLEANGITWEIQAMEDADVSKLDEKCVIALIVGAFRAERFCDGALLGFLESGAITRWLERLKEIDEQ